MLGLALAGGCSEHRPAGATSLDPVGLAKSALTRTEFRWDSTSAEDYTIYAPRGSYAAIQMTAVQPAIEEALARGLRMLGDTTLPGHFRVFHVDSRADLESIVGRPATGYADASAVAVVLAVTQRWRPAHRHEIMHVLSLRAWGHPGTNGWAETPPSAEMESKGSWLREGLPAAAEDLCGNFSYRGIAAQMQAEGQLLSLDTLRNAFLEQDDLAAYLQAGTLVQYLLMTYDLPRFRELWRDGGRDLQRIYGESPASIERGWHEWLRLTTDARPASIAALREQRCAPPRSMVEAGSAR